MGVETENEASLTGLNFGGKIQITLSALESKGLLLLLGDAVLGGGDLLPKIGGEADQIEVLLDVVHDFGLEESLKTNRIEHD